MVARLGIAVSNWDGTRRTHLYDREVAHFEQRTLCGKSVLGWEKHEMEVLWRVDCKICERARRR